MGQYYKPICLDAEKSTPIAWLYSHDYGNGLKLMEHSWLSNGFVGTVESLLMPGGAWYKQPIVWAGDYADEESGSDVNLYSLCESNGKIRPAEYDMPAEFRYIINHTKKVYVDKTKVPVTDTHNGFEFRIHPLPLLTCEGNGQGGGDFRGSSDLVGSWARNIISVETEIPAGYTELVFDLVE